jgi:hypothetical protein
VEVAGAGSAREQFAQRVGRLLHGRFKGEFHTVFTPDELQRYRGRFFGVEAEGLEVEFIQVGKLPGVTTETPRAAPRRMRGTQSAPRETTQPRKESADPITQIMTLPAVAAKINQAKKAIGKRTAPYLDRVLRYCWTAALSPKEIAEGLGITDASTHARMSSACKAAQKIGLMTLNSDGRYQVNQAEIQRLKVLSNIGG